MTPELQEKGLAAYEQARAFEQLRRRRVPLLYALATLVFVIAGLMAWRWGRGIVAEDFLATGVIVGICAGWNWHRLRLLYARNLALLAELENQYGEETPWLQVERHLAALAKLEAELAEERRKTGLVDG